MNTSRLIGYRKKPFAIYFFSAIYLVLPLLSLLQFSLDLDGSGSHLKEILFSQAFLLEVFLSFSAAWAIFSVTQIGFFYFLGISLYVCGAKFYAVFQSNLFESPLDIIGTLLWLGTSLFLFFSTLRIPYLNPKVQWWTQKPRYAHYCSGVLLVEGCSFPIVTLDISGTGIFLKADERADSSIESGEVQKQTSSERRERQMLRNTFLTRTEIAESQKKLDTFPHKTGHHLKVRVHLIDEAAEIFPHQDLEAEAVVVWATKPGSHYRYGLGLEFVRLTAEQRKQLAKYIRLIKKLTHLKHGR